MAAPEYPETVHLNSHYHPPKETVLNTASQAPSLKINNQKLTVDNKTYGPVTKL